MARTLSVSDARQIVDAAPRWLALTGAGMSVDSGVPPFRGPGGLWSSFDPEEYAHVDTLDHAPERAWELFRLLGTAIAGARPHAGHRALARAEAEGRVVGVATQNIDGLHQAAGSREVVELHGSMRRIACHACGAAGDPRALDAAPHDAPVPRCGCGGVLRPEVTLFGEMLPDGTFERAVELLESAGNLLVIGSSAEVWPVAGLPSIARAQQMEILAIGPEPTRLTAENGALWIRGTAAEVVPALFDGHGGESAADESHDVKRAEA